MKNILLSIFSISIACILIEIIVGIIVPAPVVYPIYISGSNGDYSLSLNKNLVYVPRPNTGEFNSKGYRGREYEYTKPLGMTRIIMIGDSVVEGVGVSVDDRFSALLAHRMGDNYEVINLGVRGYNILQEVEYFKTVGIRYEPDILFVCVTFNDLELHSIEMERFDSKLASMNAGKYFGNYYSKKNRIAQLLLKFNLYRYLYLFKLNIAKHNRTNENSFYGSVDNIISSSEVRELIDDLIKMSIKHEFRLAFIFLPVPKESSQLELIRSIVREKGIEIIDIYEYTRKMYNREEINEMFIDFCHLSETGHRNLTLLLWNIYLCNAVRESAIVWPLGGIRKDDYYPRFMGN